MSLKKLKSIDKRTKYSVYGWIREKGKKLKIKAVPSIISAICILYFREEEIFNIISDNGIELSENKRMITKIGDDAKINNNNYGIIKVNSGSGLICRWDLKAIKISDYTMIGIASKQFPTISGSTHQPIN